MLEVLLRPGVRAGRAYWAWASVPARGWLLRPLTIGLLAALLLLPLDGPVARLMLELQPGGEHAIDRDLRVVFNALGQFGDLATSLLIAWAFWLTRREQRLPLLDWLFTAFATFLAVSCLKMLLGRARPILEDPFAFAGLWTAVPIHEAVDPSLDRLPTADLGLIPTYSWEFWRERTSQLWSMPSSHAVFAVLLAMIIVRLAPKLAPVAWTCVTLACLNRILLGVHYPSDVAIGATLGVIAVRGLFDRQVIERLRWARTPPNLRPIPSRVGKLPALANAIRTQRGEERLPEQASMDAPPPRH
jgi:membrane-associated phospholipid phosphatase